MDIPPEVKSRLIATWIADQVDLLRGLADRLRDDALDVWADEADAVADSWAAWQLIPADLMTDEEDVATGDELRRRSSALIRAIRLEDDA